MKILSISPFHDSSACLIDNGKIKYFYKEERLSKVKRDAHPFNSIKKITDQEDDIDIALVCSPTQNDQSVDTYINFFKKIGIKEVVDLSEQHHVQHASLAFYNSGYNKALVFVIDRNGSLLSNVARESESVFIAEYPNNFKMLHKAFWVFNQEDVDLAYKTAVLNFPNVDINISSTHGIVKIYETATTLIGQHPLENGKTMGLSSYGKSDNNLKDISIYSGHGNFNILKDDFRGFSYNKVLKNSSIDIVPEIGYELYANYAYMVQNITQNSVLELIKKYIRKTGITNVVICGGYGLNVVANRFYKDSLPEIDFYIEPISDDTGNSIGGALFYHYYKTKSQKKYTPHDQFFHGDRHKIPDSKKYFDAKEIAEQLNNQKSIAIYNSFAEAGPRALGNRSILFDPRNPDAKNIVNKIKKREWYRPFAACSLKDDAYKYFYFDDEKNSKNMTINFYANEDGIRTLPGVIHIDKTCRLQLVDDENNPLFKILTEFKKITGVGVLLNTSFNLAGMPLVETPDDAIFTLNNSSIDYLWFYENRSLFS